MDDLINRLFTSNSDLRWTAQETLLHLRRFVLTMKFGTRTDDSTVVAICPPLSTAAAEGGRRTCCSANQPTK
jgi:hypothetical protein